MALSPTKSRPATGLPDGPLSTRRKLWIALAGVLAFGLIQTVLAMASTIAFDPSTELSPMPMIVILATIVTIASLASPSRFRRLPPIISSIIGVGTVAMSYLWLDQFVLPKTIPYRPEVLALLVLMSVALVLRLMAIAMIQAAMTGRQVAGFAVELAIDGALSLIGGGSSDSGGSSSSGGGGSFGGGGASGSW